MSIFWKRQSINNNNNNNLATRRETIYEQAIEIDPPDDTNSEIIDVEAGIHSSRCALMHNFEEERPTSLVMSIKESARSSRRKIKFYCSFFINPIKKLLSTFKLLIIIGLYSFLGAHLFMHLEVETDLAEKEEIFHKRKIAREVMILNLRAIHYDNKEDHEERWKHAILGFEKDLSLDEPIIETAWTFWMSFLYAGTIFTTIGYGNIACKTRSGQIATMIYAFAGIPIMLVMLNSLNNFLLKWIKIISNQFCDFLLFTGVRFGFIEIRENETRKKRRYTLFSEKMKKWGFRNVENDSIIKLEEEEKEKELNLKKENEENESDEVEQDPPVFSTLFATISWIMLSAAVFCLFEDWSFFTSFYFCFISLTTIGLGDVTPANPEYMIATFGVVLVGLSMLTVCIDVIKEKIALMYMALLQKLLKDYMEAVKNGDPNAASMMMAGFQGKAKFLMPLISKNEGTKVMNRFKNDCSKRGIEPPRVLTDINLETGMPAFANASREEFNDYIEIAEEKLNGNQENPVTQAELTKSSVGDFSTPNRSPLPSPIKIIQFAKDCQVGNSWATKFVDLEQQTEVEQSSDEGIQTDFSSMNEIDEKCCQTPIELCFSILPKKYEMIDSSTQFDPIIEYTTTGVQPEVSSIFLPEYLSSSNDFYSNESDLNDESDNESEIDHNNIKTLIDDNALKYSKQLQSPPIEITPDFSDDEQHVEIPTELDFSKLTLQPKVKKSPSMDSTETVIHFESDNIGIKTLKKKKTKKRKGEQRKYQMPEVRFLTNSANQASVIMMDSSSQYENQFQQIDNSCQYDIKTKKRKCQTKLSSINQEQLCGIRESLRKRQYESEDSRRTSESGWSIKDDDKITEISIDLSLSAIGVDEMGRVVDIPKQSISSQPIQSIFNTTHSNLKNIGDEILTETSPDVTSLWSDEEEELESLQELELFSIDAQIQTKPVKTFDKQISVTPFSLENIKNCMTQTTIIDFHPRNRTYSSESTSSSENRKTKVEKNEANVQTIQTLFYKKENEQNVDENITNYLCDIESQTIPHKLISSATSFDQIQYLNSSTQTENEEPEKCDIFSQTKQINIMETSIQTENEREIEKAEFHCQTDSVLINSSFCQTEKIIKFENEQQTDEISKSSMQMQTDDQKPSEINNLETDFTQTENIIQTEIEVQTENFAMKDFSVQSEFSTSSTKCQTEIVGSFVDSETQHILLTAEANVQALPATNSSFTQHSLIIETKSCQTENNTKNKRCQETFETDEKSTETQQILKIDNEVQSIIDTSSINLSPIRISADDVFTMTESLVEDACCQVDENSFEISNDDEEDEWKPDFSGLGGPLWSDFDYVPEVDDEEWLDDETQTNNDLPDQTSQIEVEQEKAKETTKKEDENLKKNFEESSVQVAPSSSDVKIQTVKFKKKKDEKKAEMSTSTVQATADMTEQSAGGIGNEDWLQVYVQELDEERRQRMSDIGIQTGVLARVQHMYTLPISDDVTSTSSAPITLRKSSGSEEDEENDEEEAEREEISVKTNKESEHSIGPSVSVSSISDSMDDKLSIDRPSVSPFGSRQSSVKKTKRLSSEFERKNDKNSLVQDLRAKFETKSPTLKDENERNTSMITKGSNR